MEHLTEERKREREVKNQEFPNIGSMGEREKDRDRWNIEIQEDLLI